MSNRTPPVCPACGSHQTYIHVRPIVSRPLGVTAYHWVNGRECRCHRCGYVWDRRAACTIEAPPAPWWRRALAALASLITRDKEIR